MARARSLKPGFFANEYLALLSPHARLLFIGLWTLADREGRLEDRPLKIKGALFPFETVDVDALLDELANSPEHFIWRYEIECRRFIQVTNFTRHQNPHKKEAESLIPPQKSEKPSKGSDEPSNYPASPEKDRTSPADSLYPLTLNPISPNPESDACASGDRVMETFDRFWDAYPNRRKVDRQGCLKRWKAQRLYEQADAIMAGLAAWKASPDWQKDDGQYICAPMVWLNQSRWESLPGGAIKPPTTPDTSARDALMGFPYAKHLYTSDPPIPTSALEIQPDDATNVYWNGQPLIVAQMIGLMEGADDGSG